MTWNHRKGPEPASGMGGDSRPTAKEDWPDPGLWPRASPAGTISWDLPLQAHPELSRRAAQSQEQHGAWLSTQSSDLSTLCPLHSMGEISFPAQEPCGHQNRPRCPAKPRRPFNPGSPRHSLQGTSVHLQRQDLPSSRHRIVRLKISQTSEHRPGRLPQRDSRVLALHAVTSVP